MLHLAQLQHHRRQQLEFARDYRIRRLRLRAAHEKLAGELEKVGLRLQGSEVRGLAAMKNVLAQKASPENTEHENGR